MADNQCSNPLRKIFSIFTTKRLRHFGKLALNIACHGTAIFEVYILLRFMEARSGLLIALVLEALTKLVNVVGALSPGNVGTYEGGNMIIARLFLIPSAAGLTMALCRRARILFWAAIGALCLAVMFKSARRKLAHADASFARKRTGLAAI